MLPNIKEMINKHWHILSINSSFKEKFNNMQPMIAFCKNTSLQLDSRLPKKTVIFALIKYL